jgi:2,3-dihydroxyphenylpropionate 1,2-dioxygenase
MSVQARELNEPFWQAYEAQAAALRAFDPELVFVFGADHYEGQHMRAMPTFMVAHAAEAIDDRGGYPGRLNVPTDIAKACAETLVSEDFDISVSYEMTVDHGFSSVIHHSLGAIDARPIVPLFVNCLSHPRPSLRRVRQFGACVGRFAASLGKRVAFLGSGGLSHETGDIFPQVYDVRDQPLRDYLIHGGAKGAITREQWRQNLNAGLAVVNELLVQKTPGVGEVRPAWDEKFLHTLTNSHDLRAFDSWEDEQILQEGGNGAGEIREWIAALAAAHAAGAAPVAIDHYEAGTRIGVAAVVAHASSARSSR